MPNIIYEYADGQKILVKSEAVAQTTRGGATDTKTLTKNVSARFEDAFQVVKPTIIAIKNSFGDALPDEFSVEFSLKAEGEAGLFMVCSTAIGAEFKITATWKKENKSV